MPRKIIEFNLDSTINNFNNICTVKQFDDVDFNIIPLNQGVSYDITGSTCKLFVGINEDLFMQTNNISIVDNKVKIKLDKNILQKEGYAYGELELTDTQGTITTSSFMFCVNSKIGEGANVPGMVDNFVTQYEKLIAKLRREVDNFKKELSDNELIRESNANDKLQDVETRFQTITVKQQQDAEVIDARKGEISLRKKIDKIDEQFISIDINKKDCVTIKQFGGVCDGTKDDSLAFQKAIDYCIQNKKILTASKNDKILLESTITINAGVSINLEGAELLFKNLESGFLINFNSPNEFNGIIENLTINCTSTTAIAIDVISSRRMLFQNINIKDFTLRGFRFNEGVSAGGSRLHSIFMTCTKSCNPNTVALEVDSPDLFVSGLDYVDVTGGCLHKSGNLYLNDFHGFIYEKIETVYPSSFFYRCTGNVICTMVTPYPDTQKKWYDIVGSDIVPFIKIIGQDTWMNNNALTEEILQKYGEPYAFHIDNKMSTRRITVSSSHFRAPLYNGKSRMNFININEHFIKIGGDSTILQFKSNTLCSSTNLELSSTSQFSIVESDVKCVGSSTYITFTAKYNPYGKEKLPRTITENILGKFASAQVSSILSDMDIVSIGVYGKENGNAIVHEGNVVVQFYRGSVGTGGSIGERDFIYITSTVDDYVNNKNICDTTNNTNYIIKATLCLPVTLT